MRRSGRNRLLAAAASVLLALSAIGAEAQNPDAFTKANEEYAAGRFREAIELYGEVVERGETSAALFYNLGNAWFRTGEFGQAILQYQRALVLEPQHPEAQANLRLARDKARALELRQSWWDRMAGRGTPAQYAMIATVSFWCGAFCIAAVLLRRRRSAPLKILAAVSLLVATAAATALYLRETGSHGKAFAIVTAKNVQARLATADNAATVLVLPPGSEIKVLSERGDWMYAALPNELRGWIPADSAERVRL
jgi:tetratricopeptide (TPR) repeat protein